MLFAGGGISKNIETFYGVFTFDVESLSSQSSYRSGSAHCWWMSYQYTYISGSLAWDVINLIEYKDWYFGSAFTFY